MANQGVQGSIWNTASRQVPIPSLLLRRVHSVLNESATANLLITLQLCKLRKGIRRSTHCSQTKKAREIESLAATGGNQQGGDARPAAQFEFRKGGDDKGCA